MMQPSNATHENDNSIGTYTAYLRQYFGKNGMLNIAKNSNKCTAYKMSIYIIIL